MSYSSHLMLATFVNFQLGTGLGMLCSIGRHAWKNAVIFEKDSPKSRLTLFFQNSGIFILNVLIWSLILI